MNRKNLYRPNQPAEPEIFVGRDQYLQIALNNLTCGGICYSFFGRPGVGKTSLLYAIQRGLESSSSEAELGSVPIPIYVECKRNEDTITLIVNQLIRKFESRYNFNRDHVNTLISDNQNLENVLTHILDYMFTQTSQSHLPVILLDHLHRIAENNSLFDLFSSLQTVVNQKGISLALSGRLALNEYEEFRNDVSPLPRLITLERELENLTLSETDQLVSKARTWGWIVEDGCVDYLYHELTRGCPYRLHYYLHRSLSSYEGITLEKLRLLTSEQTEQHLNRMLSVEPSNPITPSTSLSQGSIEKAKDHLEKDELDEVLEILKGCDHHQQQAVALKRRLYRANFDYQKGVLSRNEWTTECNRICDQIIELIYREVYSS